MDVTLEAKEGGTIVTFVFKEIPSGIRPEDNTVSTLSTLEKLACFVDERWSMRLGVEDKLMVTHPNANSGMPTRRLSRIGSFRV